jgi:hypothetical protein
MKYSQHIVENNDYVNSENWQVPDYSCHVHSLQPKTVNAFQRVELDDVKLC